MYLIDQKYYFRVVQDDKKSEINSIIVEALWIHYQIMSNIKTDEIHLILYLWPDPRAYHNYQYFVRESILTVFFIKLYPKKGPPKSVRRGPAHQGPSRTGPACQGPVHKAHQPGSCWPGSCPPGSCRPGSCHPGSCPPRSCPPGSARCQGPPVGFDLAVSHCIA